VTLQRATSFNEILTNHIVAKVRSGKPITTADMDELKRGPATAGTGYAGSFGLLIHSIVDFDRAAAELSFATFLDDKPYTRNEITFVNLVIGYLAIHGTIDPRRLYESPFTALALESP